jgi:CheY-like chemotaxis protein
MLTKQLTPGPIVIIEDDVDDQFLLKKVFERIGFMSELIFFDNGKEAFQYLTTTDQHTFLILCDINMPVMNGLELRAQLNNDELLRRKSIPFIFLSTAVRTSDIEKAYDMTVQGFFQKETTLDKMEEVLHYIVMYWNKSKHPNSIRNNTYQ